MVIVASLPAAVRLTDSPAGYYPQCLWETQPPPPTAVAWQRRYGFALAADEPAAAGGGAAPLAETAALHPEVALALTWHRPGRRWRARVRLPAGVTARPDPFLLLASLATLNVLRPSPLPRAGLVDEACRLLCRAAGPPADHALLHAAARAMAVTALP